MFIFWRILQWCAQPCLFMICSSTSSPPDNLHKSRITPASWSCDYTLWQLDASCGCQWQCTHRAWTLTRNVVCPNQNECPLRVCLVGSQIFQAELIPIRRRVNYKPSAQASLLRRLVDAANLSIALAFSMFGTELILFYVAMTCMHRKIGKISFAFIFCGTSITPHEQSTPAVSRWSRLIVMKWWTAC